LAGGGSRSELESWMICSMRESTQRGPLGLAGSESWILDECSVGEVVERAMLMMRRGRGQSVK
jgi:hypothetical protein